MKPWCSSSVKVGSLVFIVLSSLAHSCYSYTNIASIIGIVLFVVMLGKVYEGFVVEMQYYYAWMQEANKTFFHSHMTFVFVPLR